MALGTVWRWLGVSMDLMVVVLLIFAGLRGATADEGHPSPWAWIWMVAFAVVYAISRLRPDRARAAWLVPTIICFAGLAVTAPDGVYLAFPLFFLVMNVVVGPAAIALVAVVAAIAVGAIAVHGGWSVGGVVGPLLGAAVAVVVGMGFRMLLNEAESRAAAIDQLLAARADVAEMSRRAGELDERARLAADIHDTVAQGLSSIQLLLHSVESTLGADDRTAPDTAADRTDQDATNGPNNAANAAATARALESVRMARRVAADNLGETRRIIAALQPGPLAGADLQVALARVCAATPATVDGSPTEFVVDGDARPLPADVEATFVRVAQASIANVARHARASRCTVTLTHQPDSVSLDIVDDGIGFDPAAAPPRGAVGIEGVRRRVAVLGGSVSIESAPGAGCGVSIRIPLDDGPGTPTDASLDTAPDASPDPEETP